MSDFSSVRTVDLEREVGELAAHIHAATCRWLLLVAELDRREAWKAWGSKSCADWLSYRCGIAPGAAREQVRVARRLEELPSVCAAFGRGELSFSKVRAISRVATCESEDDLLELAQHSTAAQLERITRAYRGAVAKQMEDSQRAHDRRYLSYEWADDGSLTFRGRLPAEDGALLVKSIEASREQLRVSAETSEEADVTATNADAIVAVAESSLASGEAARNGGDRTQVVVHVSAETLAEDAAEGECRIEHGPALAPETARRLACDASLVAMTETEGRTLSVGRKTRSIPPALRRALRKRDGGCQFPGCDQHRHVDAHHIQHWAHGGETELANLMLLCRHHHRLLHEGGYTVARQGNRPVFRRPDGQAIPRAPRPPRGNCAAVHRAGTAVTEETPVARSAGQPLRLGDAVERVLHAGGQLDDEPPLDSRGVSAETLRGAEQSP